MFYAVENTYADLRNGNHGFANTWSVGRFETKKERDDYVANNENSLARAVTRKEAEYVWKSQYWCVSKEPPIGGLFGKDKYGDSYFNYKTLSNGQDKEGEWA